MICFAWFSHSAWASDSASLPLSHLSTGLPGTLGASDAARYKEIFELQERGQLRKADKLIEALQDPLLMGHVLYQRYMHPTAYRSRYKELKAWLDHYADHPGAEKIYRLALKRRPANYKYPQKPQLNRLKLSIPPAKQYRSTKNRSRAEARRVRQLKRQVRRNVLRTRLTKTEELLETAEVRRLFDKTEIDWAKAQIARGWYFYGRLDRASALLDPAVKRSGANVPDAPWFAGLIAWREGNYEAAAAHFGQVAGSSYSSDWTASAGAYWASRAHLRLRQPAESLRWLRQAQQYHRTFYGLVAASALVAEPRLDFGTINNSPAVATRLEQIPAGRRALGLLQVDQSKLAERELLHFGEQRDPQVIEALLLLASEARLPALALKLGRGLAHSEEFLGAEVALDAALYPVPPWQPTGGYKVDRALIYAFMRQESAFNPSAKSRDGARGLMQLMPNTASYISKGKRYRGKARDLLLEPGLNLQLGQRYLSYLLEHQLVAGDLFRLTTAYNGGPGNLAKWQRAMGTLDDPLLFIESLPSRETRLFIERVLSNLWIYRHRLGQDTPSRREIASGAWPRYQAMDIDRSAVASNAQDEQN